MPTISMFFGIIIRMYFGPREHNPPHFHAYYQNDKATVNIDDVSFIESNLPSRQSKMVLAWAEIHKEELMANWKLIMNGEQHLKLNLYNNIGDMMYFSVKSVKAMKGYRLLITFENNEERIFDMKPYLDKGVFKELKDINLFNSVRISFDTVEWPNYVDMDPELLYQEGESI